MKRFSRGLLPVLCLLALCAGCGSSTTTTSESELAIDLFYERLGSEDYAGVLNLYNAEVRQALQMTGGQVDEGYVEWARTETKMGKVSRIEIVEESTEGDTSDVKYRVVYGDGTKANRSVKLTREAGEWKLGYIDNI